MAQEPPFEFFLAAPGIFKRVIQRTTPAHDARWAVLGKRLMSVPISAMMAAAVTGPVAGKVSSPVLLLPQHAERPGHSYLAYHRLKAKKQYDGMKTQENEDAI